MQQPAVNATKPNSSGLTPCLGRQTISHMPETLPSCLWTQVLLPDIQHDTALSIAIFHASWPLPAICDSPVLSLPLLVFISLLSGVFMSQLLIANDWSECQGVSVIIAHHCVVSRLAQPAQQWVMQLWHGTRVCALLGH